MFSTAFPFENPPTGLQTSMFLPTLHGQMSDEQKKKWLGRAENWEIIGTYAQTELGHGTKISVVQIWWPGSIPWWRHVSYVMRVMIVLCPL